MTPPRIEGVWRPLSAEQMCAVMEPLGARWWVAGGVAIDLFVGERTRSHADIDIAMRRADVLSLSPLDDAFELAIAHDGTLIPWAFGPLRDEHHQLWVRRRGVDSWAFEVLFEEERAGAWTFRRDARITRPWQQFGATTAAGIPYIAPEVALLYTSKEPRDRDLADFEHAAPRLSPSARAWLREALIVVYGRHPWIDTLA